MNKVLSCLLCAFTILANVSHAQCPPPGYPPTGDLCPTAPTLCVDLNGYCATLGTNNQQQTFPGCGGNVLNNDEWFAFIAGSTTITLQIVPSNCQGPPGNAGMQGAIYEGGCGGDAVATQCDCADATFTMTGNFIPGQVYYVVFDGCAGDICDFQVNVLQGSTLPIPPEAPVINPGPTNVCPGATVSYSLANPNAATFEWEVIPASLGTVSGSPGGEVQVTWAGPGMGQLCVTPSNPCFLSEPPVCIPITSTNPPQTVLPPMDLCDGQTVFCAGQPFNAGTGPAGIPVTLTNYLGCDSVVVCIINAILPISTNLGQVTMCAPNALQICGINYTFSEPFLTHICEGASWQGCDSTVYADLAILDPQVYIEDPAVLGCGTMAEITLVATGSNFSLAPGGDLSLEWTGPGILGDANSATVTINQPGQYCFEITTSRGNVSCSDIDCVTVTSNIQLPQQPQVSGNMTPCQGSTATYTVTPVGNPAPSGYVWTTPGNVPFTQVNSTTISIAWPSNAVGGQLCVSAENDCGLSTPACITITPQAGAPVPVLTGPTTVCANNQTQVFSVTAPPPGITYNWTVPTGATYTGSGASITVNFSNAAPGNGQVCVTSQNSCNTSQPVCIDLTITGVPSMPTMSGPASVCTSGGNYTYTVANPPSGVTYNWTVPTGATLTGSGASVTVSFNGASSGQVCVTAQNPCGTSAQACQPVQVTTAPVGTISGAGDICQGSNESVDLTITLTGTGPWDVSYALNGGTPTSINVTASPYTLTVNQPGTYTLTSVGITNANCIGTTMGSAVVVQNPSPVATLSGSGSICAGSGQTVALSLGFTGVSPWTVDWTLDGNAQAPFQVTTNPYTWNIGEAQAGSIALTNVVDGNGCDGTTTGNATVTVNDAPTVSGISASCEPTNQFFTVVFTINGGDPASYSIVPLNGSLVGNVFTSDPIPSGSGYSFIVSDVNDCNPVTVAQNAVICDCESAVGEMDVALVEICGDGPASVQYDDANQNFDGNDALAFVLHLGSGLSIVNPVLSTSTTPTVSFNASTMDYGTTYYLSAVVGDGDGAGGVDLNDPCLQVAQGTPIVFHEIPTATLSGATAICEGTTGQLSVAFTGASPWGISYDDGTGNIQVLSGITQNPYSLAVSALATSDFCLTAMEDSNCSGTASGCATVTVNTAVAVTGLDVVCNATSTAYTVSFTITGGDASSYTVTGVTGNLVGNVFTSDPIPSGTGYSLVVDDVNSCDPQTIAQTLVDCDCTTDAGTMSTVLVEVCGDGPANLSQTVNPVTDGDDIIRYVLRPDDFAQVSTILASNDLPTFSFIPGTMTYGTTYYVSAIAGNDDGTGHVDLGDPCVDVSSPSTPVVFNEVPTATLSGTQSICEGETTTLTVNLTGDSPWALAYQPTGGGAPVTVTANSSPFQIQVTPTTTTTYSLVSLSSGACAGTVDNSTAIVSVTNPPTIANLEATCDPTGQTFVVSFQIQGGDPLSYTVTPSGTLIGDEYSSTPLPDGSSYTYNVDDANGCGPTVVSGTHVCNCTTEAGTMPTGLITVCAGDTAIASPATGTVLDPNDVLVYYLHTGSTTTLGTVLGTNSVPSFTFNLGAMSYGTTYYISAVAGNNNGNGGVNLQDPCRDISIGTPVVFYALPTISISGTTIICQGESAQLTLSVTGTGPFTVNYTVNSVPQTPQIIPTPGTFPLPPISTTTTVALISISDIGTGCTNASTQTATVTVNPNVDAGTSLGNLSFCEGEIQSVDLDDQLTGATPGGQWTGPSGVVSAGIVNTATLAPGNHDYTYTVQGIGNCPDDTVTVTITINPTPVADAGADQLLTCDVLTVPLGGDGTTPGAIYTWTGGTVVDSTSATTSTSTLGTYTLTVDALGCTATDVVVVSQSAMPPNLSIVISDVSCFGDNDGFVQVDSVWGGVGPYMYSLDGSPLSSTLQFTNLGPGEHTVNIVDAVGCEQSSTFTVGEPVEVTVEIVGNFGGNNNEIELGDELVLSILSTPPSGELDSILWSTQGIDSCQTCPSITVTPTQQTTYTVLVDEGGCSASDGITVIVSKNRPVYVPNAFSPNDDGINDLFTIYAGKSVTNIKSFLVFNRWGESMYENFGFAPNDPLAGWNGELRGKKMQPAVFTWFAEIEFIDGRIELFRGDVTLVR